jgi:hypothetical protein
MDAIFEGNGKERVRLKLVRQKEVLAPNHFRSPIEYELLNSLS